MTASLLIFVPVALLFIVAGLCFVGCILDSSGLGGPESKPKPFNKYSDTDVLPTAVAYWPLDEKAPADDSMKLTARDATNNGHDGEYKHKGNAPALFPCPAFQLAPGVDSADAIGFLSLGVEAIVPGDAEQPPADPPVPKTGMQVNGGFVTVPVSSAINPPAFTVEAWVRPEWDATATPAYRMIIDSRNQEGGLFFGFAVWVDEGGNWGAQLGATGSGNFIELTAGAAALSTVTHVVLTFDGTKATLFTNGTEAGSASLPAGTTFAPNTTTPLVIGVGLPYLPPRTQPSDNNFFPLLPFNGTIQDVAIYDTVLDTAVINTHFDDGSGNGPPEPAG